MSIFGTQADKAVAAMDKEKIKAAEFSDGLTLQFVSVEKTKSQYGAAEDAAIVERGILEEGEQFLYTFKDAQGDTRKHYSTSFPLFIAMQHAEIEENGWLLIKRTGTAKDTKYTVEKVEAPEQPITAEDVGF